MRLTNERVGVFLARRSVQHLVHHELRGEATNTIFHSLCFELTGNYDTIILTVTPLRSCKGKGLYDCFINTKIIEISTYIIANSMRYMSQYYQIKQEEVSLNYTQLKKLLIG